MKYLYLFGFIGLLSIGGVINSELNANEPLNPDSRMYYWSDYGGTGESYVICSGMPFDCLPDIIITATIQE